MDIPKKINISIISFVVLAILFIGFVIYPIFVDIKDASEELISQKKSLATFQAKIENIEKFKVSYQEFEQGLQQVDDLFIDADVPIDFFNFLEKNAESCQLGIKIFPTASQGTKQGAWLSQFFRISISGSFSGLLKFVERLETGFYLIEIQNLNFSRSGEGSVSGNLYIKVYTK